MAFENLPGIIPNFIDGNLLVLAGSKDPVVLVMGTAASGESDRLTTVTSPSTQAASFGKKDGTLIRGMYEAITGGATNIRLMRIGAKAAVLSGVGGGITITTLSKDLTAGDDYKLFWDDSDERLYIYRASDDLLVYDNNPAYPSAAVDEFEIQVSGAVVGLPGAGGRADIGTAGTPVTLTLGHGVGGASFVAGDDGILLSRMELYEALYKSYKLLENEDIDVVLPMNVYLDDLNVMDMTTAQRVAAAAAITPPVYPDPGTTGDVLGKVFVQEYQGEYYFWWDLNLDGVAEIYPSVGSASATKDANNVTLTTDDFHEVNFGYQLADFCYRQSEDNEEMTGVIGVLPPTSWSLKDISSWIGAVPTTALDGAGNNMVTANGSGLLGNKWVAGRRNNAGTGLPGFSVDSLSGLADGGFIATNTGWVDGEQQYDRNDHMIDIGKYLSIVGAQAIFSNSTSTTSYVASAAAYYGGFYAALPANSAPTNKVTSKLRLPYRISVAKLDALAGKRFVMLQQKSKGVVISDAPTATRPDSDYRRLSTVRIVKACVDSLRVAAEPFLGEAITGARLAALETAIERALTKLQKLEYIQRYDVVVTSTPNQQVLGQANVELVIVPAFELRTVTVNVALAAQ